MLREAVKLGRWGRDRKEGGQRINVKSEMKKEKRLNGYLVDWGDEGKSEKIGGREVILKKE